MKERLTQEQFKSIMYSLNGIEDFGDDTKVWKEGYYGTGDGEKGWEILDRLTQYQQLKIIEDFIGNFPDVAKCVDIDWDAIEGEVL